MHTLMVEHLKPGFWIQAHNFTDTFMCEVVEVEPGPERTVLHIDKYALYTDHLPPRSYLNGTPIQAGISLEDLAGFSRARMKIMIEELNAN